MIINSCEIECRYINIERNGLIVNLSLYKSKPSNQVDILFNVIQLITDNCHQMWNQHQ